MIKFTQKKIIKLISGKLDSICNLGCPVKEQKKSEEYRKEMLRKYFIGVRECDSEKTIRKDKLFIYISGLKKKEICEAKEFKEMLEKKYWLIRFCAIYLGFL